jgi:hypothetical protein
MAATWVKITGIGILLVALGCRHQQPNLKPPPSQEALNTPPQEKRFNTSDYPKEAFIDRDPLKKLVDDTQLVPTQGKSMAGMQR